MQIIKWLQSLGFFLRLVNTKKVTRILEELHCIRKVYRGVVRSPPRPTWWRRRQEASESPAFEPRALLLFLLLFHLFCCPSACCPPLFSCPLCSPRRLQDTPWGTHARAHARTHQQLQPTPVVRGPRQTQDQGCHILAPRLGKLWYIETPSFWGGFLRS